MLRGFYPLIVILSIGILIAIFSVQIQRWYKSVREDHEGIGIGLITHAEGSVRCMHLSDIDLIPSPTEHPYEIHDGDTLQASYGGKADVTLEGYSPMELPAGSSVKFNLWNARDRNSPLFLQVLYGKVNYPKQSTLGKVFVVTNDKLYYAGQTPTDKAPELVVPKVRPSGEAFIIDRPSTLASKLVPKELSREYIDSTIESYAGKLFDCEIPSKDQPRVPIGKVETRFTIQPNGSVVDVKIAKSSTEPEKFKDCVVDQLKKIVFVPFSGPQVTLDYPIDFQ
jgi:hypothetical protein